MRAEHQDGEDRSGGRLFPARSPTATALFFLLEGDLSFGDRAFDTLSYFILPSGEDHPALEAATDATLLMIGWSSQGEKVPFDLF